LEENAGRYSLGKKQAPREKERVEETRIKENKKENAPEI
jgi:hypothetical protein